MCCAGVVLVTNVVLYAGIGVARLLVDEPRSRHSELPSIPQLRTVDERVWVGDQPTPPDHRRLAERFGVKVVVNLRTGEGPDPAGDDPALLRSLGVDYVHLPVHDGHAPDRHTVRRFLEVVRASPGRVYVHCGGGVGRSSTMEAAYRASLGQDPSVMPNLFLGPLSLEQVWFIAALGAHRPAPESTAVRILSRVVDFPRPYFSWMARQLR